MAKSTRSKIKRAYRAKKREEGVYAAAEAARLQRLNAKLAKVITPEKSDDVPHDGSGKDDDIIADDRPNEGHEQPDSMLIEKLPRISTHGPRNSRREQWRKSKGMPARPKNNAKLGRSKGKR